MARRNKGRRNGTLNLQPARPVIPARADLFEVLKQQVDFLVRSSKAFDEGLEHEGVRLAVPLRILLHETGKSRSLLGQMGVRDSILFLDTAFPYSVGNLVAESGLALQEIEATNGRMRGRFIPHLSRPPIPDRWSGIRRWWETNVVIKDSLGEHFTRKDLVLFAAHEDGGAHVQPSLTPKYEALTRGNSLGYQLTDRGVEYSIGESKAGSFEWDNGPALASVRMIAHEVLVSLQQVLPEALGGVVVHERSVAPDDPSSIWGSV